MDSWIEIRPLVQAEGQSRRRAEGEAWRAIVRERLGANVAISYNEKGAPVLGAAEPLVADDDEGVPVPGASIVSAASDEKGNVVPNENGGGFIGVSHTKGWVAVVWSATGPCAVDIELKTRRLSVAAAERYSIASMEDWCALEAVYKYESVAGVPPDPARIRFLPHPELVVAVVM